MLWVLCESVQLVFVTVQPTIWQLDAFEHSAVLNGFRYLAFDFPPATARIIWWLLFALYWTHVAALMSLGERPVASPVDHCGYSGPSRLQGAISTGQ